jgi:hypothetical protein
VARGFESKDVEFQQSEAERQKAPKGTRALTAEQRAAQARRRTLELALTRAENELGLAHSTAHRQMLEQAVASLREQIRQIP